MTSRVLMVRDSAGTTLDKRELAPDEFVAPFTIGKAGDLCVLDAQSLPVHARAYFDGATLFVRSVEAGHPIVVNNAGVGLSWRSIPCPAVIQIGSSQIVYEEKVEPVPEPFPARPSAVRTLVWEVSRPPLSRVGLPVPPDLVTVVGPMPTLSGIPSLAPQPPAPAPSPVAHVASSDRQGETRLFALPTYTPSAPSDAAPAVELAAPGEPPAEARPRRSLELLRRARARARAEYARTPRSSRIALAVVPVLAWMALAGGKPSADSPPRANAASSSARPLAPASPAGSAAAAASAVAPASVAPLQEGSVVAKAVAGSASRPRDGAATASGARAPSLEALAADAAARGALQDALALYSELAQQNPARSEFQVITRVLKAKLSEMARTP